MGQLLWQKAKWFLNRHHAAYLNFLAETREEAILQSYIMTRHAHLSLPDLNAGMLAEVHTTSTASPQAPIISESAVRNLFT